MQPLHTFVSQSFKHFNKVGAFLPSSNRLARRMVKGVKSPIVVELGPGTGVFTKEILRRLPKHGRLICIESNETFANYLQNEINDPRMKIIIGDAKMLKVYLKAEGIEKVSCIISGLPLGNFSKSTKEGILREVRDCLEDDGEFIQFEYFLAGIRAVKSFFPSIKLSYEIFNFPPAFVMRCKK